MCLATKYIADLFLKKDKSGFVMICDTTCGYCRKEVKSVKSDHGINPLRPRDALKHHVTSLKTD